MIRRCMAQVCGLVFVFGCVFHGIAEQGMVLLKIPDDPAVNSNGSLVLKYLSDGREVLLEDCCTRQAKFSPDGKQVVARVWRADVFLWNIDGSGRTSIGGSGNIVQWCANGHIYYGAGNPEGIGRIPEGGGEGERIHNAHYDNMGPHGKVFRVRFGKGEVSMDGTKGCYTTLCRCEGSGWGQVAMLLEQDREYPISSPCVGAISPHGDLLGKANPVGGGAHTRYALYPWKRIYRYESDTRNTFYYRTPVDMCLDTFVAPGEASYGNSMAWGKDPDVLTFTLESTLESWMYRRSTGEQTKLGDGCYVEDYYGRELDMEDTSLYLTPLALEFETETGNAESLKPRMVYVKGSHALPAPTVTGAPAWLNVTAEKTGETNVRITNALNAAAVPTSPGTYSATLTVSFDGFREGNFTTDHEYSVTLNVFGGPALSFTAPHPQARYNTGETIEIGYSANCERAGDKIGIAISVDSGATWGMVDTSFLGTNCGMDQVFRFDIPDSMLFYSRTIVDRNTEGISKAVEGGKCLIRLWAYHPGGPEVYSNVFGINQEPAVSAAVDRMVSPAGAQELAVAIKTVPHASVLAIRSPRSGTARVLDIQGRTVARFAVESGARSVSLPLLRAGCFLVEVRYAGGGLETAVVNAL